MTVALLLATAGCLAEASAVAPSQIRGGIITTMRHEGCGGSRGGETVRPGRWQPLARRRAGIPLSRRMAVRSSREKTAVVAIEMGAGEVVRKYFEYWNKRQMDDAISLFADDCIYEDTLYPGFFEGKDELKKHLYAIGEALPADFRFNIDELAVSSFDEVEGLSRIGVQWHVGLADGRKLPFTRGSSMYKVNGEGKITSGFDVPEPVLKTGDANLAILKWAGIVMKVLKLKLPF
eukprot:CAMPEP_0170198810 /NCGR_PEP_ID=MMETSP0040_2-20121228/68991_1 /TAXON_ID=641309 /ORGANISM="Lotharella oceanica, Strain CCMP622" /LENGTH=233 /DNA_ID=CAMNT_0010448861 /DNA_START=307 /DNA_END=1008 /DNA_ORIENTATION=-